MLDRVAQICLKGEIWWLLSRIFHAGFPYARPTTGVEALPTYYARIRALNITYSSEHVLAKMFSRVWVESLFPRNDLTSGAAVEQVGKNALIVQCKVTCLG